MPDAPAPAESEPAPKRRGCLLEVVQTLLLTVLLFVGVQTFLVQPFKVEGGSMENTLLPDQHVLVDKLTPRWAPYARGDIVVLAPPAAAAQEGGTPFIKRVIGLPGDRIELTNGLVYVNGAALDEPYLLADAGSPEPTDRSPGAASTWLVPDGQLFVMGDHRQASRDSRSFGPIDIDDVVGRAWLRYWPIDAFGVLTIQGR